jgi:uncharacterized membrane protein (UPF0136 family)
MRWLDALVIFYGILLILMGIDGFLHKSIISLIAGGTCGILEIGFAALSVTNPRVGRIGSAIIAVLMIGKFTPDYFKDHKLAELILMVSSIVVFCCLLGGHFYAMSKRKANQAA